MEDYGIPDTYSIGSYYPTNYDIADDWTGVGECNNCGKVTRLLRTD